MITRKEFVRRLAAVRREENIACLIWLPLFFLGLFGQVFLVNWIQSLDSQLLAGAVLVEMVGFLVGNIFLVIWYVRARPRRFGLECPRCGLSLIGMASERTAQWGNCSACHTAIWVAADED